MYEACAQGSSLIKPLQCICDDLESSLKEFLKLLFPSRRYAGSILFPNRDSSQLLFNGFLNLSLWRHFGEKVKMNNNYFDEEKRNKSSK